MVTLKLSLSLIVYGIISLSGLKNEVKMGIEAYKFNEARIFLKEVWLILLWIWKLPTLHYGEYYLKIKCKIKRQKEVLIVLVI